MTLMSQPKVIKTLRADHRWSVDELIEIVPKAFGERFEGQVNNPGVTAAINAIPEGEWLDIGNGLRYWSSKLEPWGERSW
jgi:hypothetical protein